MTLDIHQVMKGLSEARPICHSEANFQFALAGQAQKGLPNSQVRMELKPFPHEVHTVNGGVKAFHMDG